METQVVHDLTATVLPLTQCHDHAGRCRFRLKTHPPASICGVLYTPANTVSGGFMTDTGRELDAGSCDGLGFDESLHQVLAGRGSGLPCAHCHGLITAAEIEYEIIEPVEAADSKAQHPTPRLHLRCYDSWRATGGR